MADLTGATTSFDALRDEVRATLKERGVLDSVRARLRAEIFNQIEGGEGRAPLSNDNMEINELIREYLEFNGYKHALGVFLAESGQPAQCPFGRSFLSQQLGVTETADSQRVPLLYGMVGQLREMAPRIARVSDQPSEEEEFSGAADSFAASRFSAPPTRRQRTVLDESADSEVDLEMERKRREALERLQGVAAAAGSPGAPGSPGTPAAPSAAQDEHEDDFEDDLSEHSLPRAGDGSPWNAGAAKEQEAEDEVVEEEDFEDDFEDP